MSTICEPNVELISNIGLCQIIKYLDLKKINTCENAIASLELGTYLIYLNHEKYKYYLQYQPCHRNTIDSHIFSGNRHFIPTLCIDTYIRYTQIHPQSDIELPPNGIYVITYVDYNFTEANHRFIHYYIKDIISGKERKLYSFENLNSIEILTPVAPILKNLILASSPQISPLSRLWKGQRFLDGDDIDSFSMNGHLVHCIAARLFSPVINAQMKMTGENRQTTYPCDEICTEMFIYLMYHYSLYEYDNIDLITKDLLRQLFEMCDYYGTDSGEYISSLLIGVGSEI